MDRALSVQEVSPGQYVTTRYSAYTDEIGAVNYPVNPNEQDTTFWPAPSAGLHFFRGGYEWPVSDQVKADLIASGVADNSNFVIAPNQGFGQGGFGEGGFGDE